MASCESISMDWVPHFEDFWNVKVHDSWKVFAPTGWENKINSDLADHRVITLGTGVFLWKNDIGLMCNKFSNVYV